MQSNIIFLLPPKDKSNGGREEHISFNRFCSRKTHVCEDIEKVLVLYILLLEDSDSSVYVIKLRGENGGKRCGMAVRTKGRGGKAGVSVEYLKVFLCLRSCLRSSRPKTTWANSEFMLSSTLQMTKILYFICDVVLFSCHLQDCIASDPYRVWCLSYNILILPLLPMQEERRTRKYLY